MLPWPGCCSKLRGCVSCARSLLMFRENMMPPPPPARARALDIHSPQGVRPSLITSPPLLYCGMQHPISHHTRLSATIRARASKLMRTRPREAVGGWRWRRLPSSAPEKTKASPMASTRDGSANPPVAGTRVYSPTPPHVARGHDHPRSASRQVPAPRTARRTVGCSGHCLRIITKSGIRGACNLPHSL